MTPREKSLDLAVSRWMVHAADLEVSLRRVETLALVLACVALAAVILG